MMNKLPLPCFLTLSTTPSTMDAAAALVKEGRTDVAGVRACTQTAGRGRNARAWVTFPPPYGLAITYILPLAGPHMALLVALGVFQALKTRWPTAAPTLALKWPNDVLLSGQKLAGILIETTKAPTGEMMALVGLGLNILAPKSVPAGFSGTFLLGPQEEGAPATDAETDDLCAHIHTCIMQYIDIYRQHGWTPELHNSYSGVCATLGHTITWQKGTTQALTGLARGLTQAGHLEMVAEDGTVHIIHSGDIIASGH